MTGWDYVNAITSIDKCLAKMSILEAAVLMQLALRMGNNDEAWPSQARLAKETGASVRGVNGALANLLERGLISTKHRYGRTNVYIIDVDACSELPQIKDQEHSAYPLGTECVPTTQPVRTHQEDSA